MPIARPTDGPARATSGKILTMDDLKQRILQLLVFKGSLSPGTIAAELGDAGTMVLGVSETVFVDRDLSAQFIEAFQALQKDGYISVEAQGANALLCITYDGGPGYKCEIAKKRDHAYKEPRWWPMTFRPTAEGEAWLRSKEASKG